MNIFDAVFIQPILNLLLLFYFVFSFIHFPFSLGFAIVALTAFVRLILAPLTAAQLKSAAKTAELRPKLAELGKRFSHDKQALSRAQMELYRQHGVNPAAGCLPLILQIPVFIALYNVLLRVLVNTQDFSGVNQLSYFSFLTIDKLPNLNFFGFNLAARPSDFGKFGIHLLLVPPITAALQYWQSKIMMPLSPKPEVSKTQKEGKPTTEDALSQLQSQMVWLMPAMIGFFSFGFPVGLALYWNIFTIFGLTQQYWMTKRFSLGKIFKFLK